jgi:hypothetical protein
MLTSLSFKSAWRDLNRKSAILALLLLTGIPGIFLLVYRRGDLFLQEGPFLVVALAWMPAIAWAGSRIASFACPRCAKGFFEEHRFFWPLGLSCAHCRLPRWAKDAPPATGG